MLNLAEIREPAARQLRDETQHGWQVMLRHHHDAARLHIEAAREYAALLGVDLDEYSKRRAAKRQTKVTTT